MSPNSACAWSVIPTVATSPSIFALSFERKRKRKYVLSDTCCCKNEKRKSPLRLFWQQRGWAFLNRKLSLGRIIHPSLSLFGSSLITMTSERARVLSLFFLSFSLSFCVQTRLLHSRLRDMHVKCIRHKGIKGIKRKKTKKMCSRTTQKRKFTRNRDWERVCNNVPLVRARVFQPLDDGAVHLHTASSA